MLANQLVSSILSLCFKQLNANFISIRNVELCWISIPRKNTSYIHGSSEVRTNHSSSSILSNIKATVQVFPWIIKLGAHFKNKQICTLFSCTSKPKISKVYGSFYSINECWRSYSSILTKIQHWYIYDHTHPVRALSKNPKFKNLKVKKIIINDLKYLITQQTFIHHQWKNSIREDVFMHAPNHPQQHNLPNDSTYPHYEKEEMAKINRFTFSWSVTESCWFCGERIMLPVADLTPNLAKALWVVNHV